MTRRWPIPNSEAAGGIALIAAAAAAILLANVAATAPGYAALLALPIGSMSLHGWIDDALMALFFLAVGLEIKRECVSGQLADPARRRLPVVAAMAGMAVPALVYVVVAGPALARGWAIPAATDIAFAVGLLALLGRRVPPALRVFLTAVAIVDDMGAVAIIALVYTAAIDWGALAAAAGIVALMLAMNRHGERRLWPYLAAAVLLWAFVFMSGVHPTIAGVVAAMTIPIASGPIASGPIGPESAPSPLHRIEHALQPLVAFAILPLFAFANAGVALAGLGPATLTRPLVIGVAAGLFVGKQVGIFGSVWIAERVGFARRPHGARWTHVYGIALLAGIGFTMSLFIGGLAFPGDAASIADVKLGVIGASILAGIAGFAVLRSARCHDGAA